MAGKQSRLVKLGLGKQTAKDTAATAATYEFGLLGGQVIAPELDEEPLNATGGQRFAEGHQRVSVVPGSEVETYGLADSIGLLLLASTGAVTTTGAAAPYTHTFTLADDLPYFTVFADYDGDYYTIDNAKADEFELSWDGAGAIEVSASLLGTTLNFADAAYTATNTEDSSDPLRSAGGTFTVDGATARTTSGSVSVTNSVEAVLVADSVEPDDVFPGICVVEFSVTVLPENLNDFRKALTGSATGTAVADVPYTGAASFSFANVAGDTLAFDASEAALLADFPAAEPDGGPAEVTIEGVVVVPSAGGDEFTFTLTNSVASY